jgi:NDP-hexose 4-ketoreductase
MSAVVVLGAAGGVGTALREQLAGHDHLIGFDRAPVAGVLALDAGSPDAVSDAATDIPPGSILINAMGRVTTSSEPAEILRSIEDNVASLALITSTWASRLAHVVHVSSVSVYGSTAPSPIPETAEMTPDTAYGGVKAAAEHLIRAICADRGIPLTIVRATQLFGLASADATLPHRLVSALADGSPFAFTGDLDCRRDYLHVSDLGVLLAAIARAPRAGVYNAGFGEPVRLGDVVAAAFSAFGHEPPRTGGSPPASFSQWLDIAAAREAFGFAPGVSLRDWFLAEAARSVADRPGRTVRGIRS